MFFTLRNHPEWQRECGMGAPRDPLVLALEKDRRAAGSGGIKRHCSACSVGQQCTRLTEVKTSAHLLDHYQAPGQGVLPLDKGSPPKGKTLPPKPSRTPL